ncbi:MAG TPA: hypothetical protein VKE95_19485 [Burkholderiales bacterium]|nr:hypothetical protein [Burkholderiales bacterium]
MNGRCLLLFARDSDPALELLRAQAPGYVRQVALADLSRPGWRYAAGKPDDARAVSQGQVIEAGDIGAVLCRIGGVAPAELVEIRPVDRAYAAAEINAFLLAWLAQFRGPRFNAPTPWSLCGPAWHEARWTQLAARAGLPLAPNGNAAHSVQATVIAGQVFCDASPELARHAARLARACELAMLGVRFEQHGGAWRFAQADSCPALDAQSAAAVLRFAAAMDESRKWAA